MISDPKTKVILVLAAAMFGVAGCHQPNSAERFGKTIYVDGAGNWGFGTREIRDGLRAAGYQGDVENYVWTVSFNPLIDQRDPIGPRLRAAILARKIDAYCKQYPQNKVNLISLSAGTGVATWAVENLNENSKINNLILLGSSLSSDYDVSKALRKMEGSIYVYHSPHDWVLNGPVKVVGTIDGKLGVESAGLVGLRPPPSAAGRVVNVGWSRKWLKLGWAGDHTDCTNSVFVREELAKHILDPSVGPGDLPSAVASTGQYQDRTLSPMSESVPTAARPDARGSE